MTRPEESYQLWHVVCDQETSYARSYSPSRGLQNTNPQWVVAPVGKKKLDTDVESETVNSEVWYSNPSSIMRVRENDHTMFG